MNLIQSVQSDKLEYYSALKTTKSSGQIASECPYHLFY